MAGSEGGARGHGAVAGPAPCPAVSGSRHPTVLCTDITLWFPPTARDITQVPLWFPPSLTSWGRSYCLAEARERSNVAPTSSMPVLKNSSCIHRKQGEIHILNHTFPQPQLTYLQCCCRKGLRARHRPTTLPHLTACLFCRSSGPIRGTQHLSSLTDPHLPCLLLQVQEQVIAPPQELHVLGTLHGGTVVDDGTCSKGPPGPVMETFPRSGGLGATTTVN